MTLEIEFRLSITINSMLEAVWDAWFNPTKLARWLSITANVELKKGGPFELFWDSDNNTRGCKIIDFDRHTSAEIQWKGPDEFKLIMNTSPFPTRLRLKFERIQDNQTTLHLWHSGWGEDGNWYAAMDWHIKSWKMALHRLKDMLERAPQA